MPGQPRLNIPELVYHFMARGIEGRDIFSDDDDREGFLKRLAYVVSKPGGPHLYAWTLMSSHFHLLLRSGEGEYERQKRIAISLIAELCGIRAK